MNLDRQIPIVEGRSTAAIEMMAEAFLRKHQPCRLTLPGMTDVISLFDLVMPDAYGFNPVVDDNLPDGILGQTDFAARTISITPHGYAGADSGEGWHRFTLAHEIGHVLTIGTEMDLKMRFTSSTGTPSQVVQRRRNTPPYRDPEWQADCFAAALLMPRGPFAFQYRHLTEADRPIKTLKRQFGVSGTAVRTRIARLEKYGWLR